MKKFFMSSLLSGLLALGSCYEESSKGNEAIQLLQGSWKLNRWTSSPAYSYTYSNGTSKSFTNLLELYNVCAHDNEYEFNLNSESGYKGTYVYREGVRLCGTASVLESNSWFVDDDLTIYFELPGSEPFHYSIKKIYSIKELTENRLVFTYKIQSGNSLYVWSEEYLRKH